MAGGRRMALMNTKSGPARNEKLDAFDQAIEPTTPSPTVNPWSQTRPSMPTIPSAIDTSTPAANRTNISPISTPPRADSLTRRSGVSRVARWSHLVAGGSSAEGRPHLPDQRGEHREGHEGQAGGNEEHRRPEWIQHDRRDTAVAIGRERGLRGHPDDDGEEGHAEREGDHPQPGPGRRRHQPRDQVDAHVAPRAEGVGGAAEDHEHLEEARHLVHEELRPVEEGPHGDVPRDGGDDGERAEARDERRHAGRAADHRPSALRASPSARLPSAPVRWSQMSQAPWAILRAFSISSLGGSTTVMPSSGRRLP